MKAVGRLSGVELKLTPPSLAPERFTVKCRSTLSKRGGKLQNALESEAIYIIFIYLTQAIIY